MKITNKELYIIEAIVSNEMSSNNYFLPSYTSSYEEAQANSSCWSETIDSNGAIHGEKVTGKKISGVVSSLRKKGFISCNGRGADSTVNVTREGWKAYQETMELLDVSTTF
jgi:hypothetical protein